MLGKTNNELRQAAKQIYGEKNVRITRNGEVHVKGEMPNTHQVGWYLLGFTGTWELEDRLFYPDGSVQGSEHGR